MLEHKIAYFKDHVDNVKASGWTAQCADRAKSCIAIYESGELDSQWLLRNLESVVRRVNISATCHESLAKIELDELINPIINQLKGA